MNTPPAVENARELMAIAQEWGVWRWLTEKRRVRGIADQATDALAAAERQVKDAWCDDLKKAYEAVEEAAHGEPAGIAAAVRQVKDAEEVAYRARLEAEDTFDEAERRMSAGLARDGSRKAIEAWDLREAAIRLAEAAGAEFANGSPE